MLKQVILGVFVILVSYAMVGCDTAPRAEMDRQHLQDDARVAIQRFMERDPAMEEFFEESHGFAIFPSITKGGAGIGGAYGRGVVYEQGELIGYTDVTQGTIGLQLGGQEYRQVIFFEDETTLRRFTRGQLDFAAQASAIAADRGASQNANFREGVLVFTMGIGGAMFEAAIGGQNFTFEPVRD